MFRLSLEIKQLLVGTSLHLLQAAWQQALQVEPWSISRVLYWKS